MSPKTRGHQPVYIAIEGLDGTGKTTLFHHLTNQLAASGISFSTLCPTRMMRPGSLPERLYNLTPFTKRIPLFRRLIFSYRSWCATRAADLKDAEIILGDRSIAGSYAKNWRIVLRSRRLTIILFNLLEPLIPAPDYILLLQASKDNIADRLKPRAYVDVDETPVVQQRMKDAYREMMGSYRTKRLANTKWIVIDADKPEQQLAREVFTMITEPSFLFSQKSN